MEVKKLGKFTFSANYLYDQHAHNHIEINYVHTGNCMMCIDQKNFALHKGDCVFLGPGVAHNFMVNSQSACKIVQFEFVDSAFLSAAEGAAPLPLYFKAADCADVYESISHLFTYHKSIKEAKAYKQLFRLETEKLSILLQLHYEKRGFCEPQYDKKPLDTIVSYLEANYMHPVQFELLSKQNGMCSRNLRKLFTKEINLSPVEYVTALRLENAKNMLKNTSCSVSNIATAVGYNSLPYFSAVFKEKIGLTPKAFRQQYRI